jgi:hypothetical protein
VSSKVKPGKPCFARNTLCNFNPVCFQSVAEDDDTAGAEPDGFDFSAESKDDPEGLPETTPGFPVVVADKPATGFDFVVAKGLLPNPPTFCFPLKINRCKRQK